MKGIINRLQAERFHNSTRKTYYTIWKQFANFFLKLDYKPIEWVDRITLFICYLIENQLQSATIKSYLSALRAVLAEDGIKIPYDNFVLSALIRASQMKNDSLRIRIPIHKNLLNRILAEITKYFFNEKNQLYLAKMYLVLFSSAYYGMLRVGEVTLSQHTLKASNVHIGTNKDKMLFLLTSSKTHNKGDKPQMIKISSTPMIRKGIDDVHHLNCPFTLLKDYIAVRPNNTLSASEQFYIFSDRSPVKPSHVRHILKSMISRIGLDPNLYSFHGIRSGRAGDLLRLGVSVETIKKLGRWKSNTVFSYLKD